MPPKRTVSAMDLMRLVENGATLEQDEKPSLHVEDLKPMIQALIDAQSSAAETQRSMIAKLSEVLTTAREGSTVEIDLKPLETVLVQMANVKPPTIVVNRPVTEYQIERNNRGFATKIVPIYAIPEPGGV